MKIRIIKENKINEQEAGAVPAELKPFRGSNLGYIGARIERLGRSIDDYDFIFDSLGYMAVPKGTYEGRGRILDRPSAQELNWRPYGYSTYFKDL